MHTCSLTCLICPIGCTLEVKNSGAEEDFSVTGNGCVRGVNYALEEIRSPKRIVTATAAIQGEALSVRRLPVKTSAPCPREKIPSLLRDIYEIKVSLPVRIGDILIADWNSEGINVIATRRID